MDFGLQRWSEMCQEQAGTPFPCLAGCTPGPTALLDGARPPLWQGSSQLLSPTPGPELLQAHLHSQPWLSTCRGFSSPGHALALPLASLRWASIHLRLQPFQAPLRCSLLPVAGTAHLLPGGTSCPVSPEVQQCCSSTDQRASQRALCLYCIYSIYQMTLIHVTVPNPVRFSSSWMTCSTHCLI